MSDYATLAELLDYLPLVSSDEDKAALGRMLTRGSRAIDAYTRRADDAFAPAPEDESEQIIYGTGQAVLLLPEFVAGSIESVTAPQGYYLPAGYVEFRRRDITTGALRVGLHTATTDKILTPRVVWASGVPFTIVARWGFQAIPGSIKEALLQLLVRWWRTKDEAFTGVIGSLGTDRTIIERGFPSGVKTLLEPYVLEEAEQDEAAGIIERGELRDADTNAGEAGGWGRN